MSVRIRLVAVVLGASLVGCGKNDSSSLDYHQKQDQDKRTPYSKEGHMNKFGDAEKGPTIPQPRKKSGPG